MKNATCKLCGRELQTEKFAAPSPGGRTCGLCTAYCTKQCKIGKSGKTQGWHFEPCLSCEKNPYNRAGKPAPLLKEAKA